MSPKKKTPKKQSKVITTTSHCPRSQLPPNLSRTSKTITYFHFLTTLRTTKSWLPARSTRCASTERRDGWPQLTVTGDYSAENPPFWGAHNRYLSDGTCIKDLPEERLSSYGHWCVLKVDTVTRSSYSPPSPASPYSEDPVLADVVLAGNGGIPCSSLIVSYVTNTRNRYDYVWIRHECTTVDPFDANKKYMEFANLVRCEGKVYAVSLQGTLVVMEDVDSRLRIPAISASRGVPSVSSRFFEEYLLEIKGEVYLVFFIHRKSLEIVNEVEVFRLCFDELEWIKVRGLQGKTLFMGPQSCYWVNSGEIGCRGDCVYFTQPLDNGWWMYDIRSGCIVMLA